ncbi:MAG: hypothetical protein HWD59_09770 [Coxiellaceae bacterium]|nr:MAG: hypothetical protein HWD59_09770 [Coxiellaceae bacterium]
MAIENDEHTFIETYNNNTHRKYDLGGYPINRKTKEFVNSAITSNNNSAQNTTKMEPIQIIEKPAPNNRYITWDHTIHANISSPEDFLSYLIDSLQRGPIVNRLIVVPSENEIQWLNWALMQKLCCSKATIFILR